MVVCADSRVIEKEGVVKFDSQKFTPATVSVVDGCPFLCTCIIAREDYRESLAPQQARKPGCLLLNACRRLPCKVVLALGGYGLFGV